MIVDRPIALRALRVDCFTARQHHITAEHIGQTVNSFVVAASNVTQT